LFMPPQESNAQPTSVEQFRDLLGLLLPRESTEPLRYWKASLPRGTAVFSNPGVKVIRGQSGLRRVSGSPSHVALFAICRATIAFIAISIALWSVTKACARCCPAISQSPAVIISTQLSNNCGFALVSGTLDILDFRKRAAKLSLLPCFAGVANFPADHNRRRG
jgi:hypothetical protein